MSGPARRANDERLVGADDNARRTVRVSAGELERRWRLVLDHRRERGIEALVVQSARDFTGGYVRWFTDVPAGYPRTIVFCAADLMTVVEHGAAGRRRDLGGDDPDHPGVGEIITTSAFPPAHYTQAYDAEVSHGAAWSMRGR